MKIQPSNFFGALRAWLRAARERLQSFRKRPKANESDATLEQKLILSVKKPHWFPRLAQLASLPRILSHAERTVLTGAVIIFVVSAWFLSRAYLTEHLTPVPAPGGNYTEAIIGSPSLVNPLWADASSADRDLSALLFAGLFRTNTSLTPEPDLADTYTVSEDGKIYTINLKPNLFWHDGAPITAGDIAFTIHALQDPGYVSPRRADFTSVTVEARDSRTVVFTLEHPNAFFLSALTVGIIPEHRWGTIAPTNARLAELNVKPVGAGPYQLKSIKKNRQGFVHSYVLERFPRYHRDAPFIDTLVLRFFDDASTAAQALARGNVDGFAFLPYELAPLISRRDDVTAHPLRLPQVTAIFLNQKKNTFLADKNIRAALAKAISKPVLIDDAFHGKATELDGPIPASNAPELTRYPYDPTAAEMLLAENGWKLQEGALTRTFTPKDKKDKRFVADTELKLKLTVVNVPEHVRAAELVREAWLAIGVATELVITEYEALGREVLPGRNFDALLHGIIMDDREDPYPFWHSSQATSPGANIAQYANRRADGLLEEARRLVDETERTKRYDEFQKIVTTELPAIFLLSPNYTYAIDNRVRGVSFDRLSSPEHRFADIANWYVKTKF